VWRWALPPTWQEVLGVGGGRSLPWLYEYGEVANLLQFSEWCKMLYLQEHLRYQVQGYICTEHSVPYLRSEPEQERRSRLLLR